TSRDLRARRRSGGFSTSLAVARSLLARHGASTNGGSRMANRTRIRLAAAFTLVAAAAGCATTQRVQVTDKNYCPFLGSTVCAQLTETAAPGRLSGADVAGSGKAESDLSYMNPEAQWTQYKKVMIAPVTFWGEDNTKVSAKDQHELTNYFYHALEKQLGKKFKVVDK